MNALSVIYVNRASRRPSVRGQRAIGGRAGPAAEHRSADRRRFGGSAGPSARPRHPVAPKLQNYPYGG